MKNPGVFLIKVKKRPERRIRCSGAVDARGYYNRIFEIEKDLHGDVVQLKPQLNFDPIEVPDAGYCAGIRHYGTDSY
jgi:hypothetical protein